MNSFKTYTITEAALICHCHDQTIRKHIKSGALIASKPGKKYCIREKDLDAFLTALHTGQVQVSLERRSEQECQFINAMGIGTLISLRQAASELDALLEQKTKRRQRNYTTKLSTNNGN